MSTARTARSTGSFMVEVWRGWMSATGNRIQLLAAAIVAS
jgi:hypothetical protein